jgi:hypothetical protein
MEYGATAYNGSVYASPPLAVRGSGWVVEAAGVAAWGNAAAFAVKVICAALRGRIGENSCA